MRIGVLAAALAVVVVGFTAGATIAADSARRDTEPVFHYLAGAMFIRTDPDPDADTVRTLPAGSILRLGGQDFNGWSPAGDVSNRLVGFIYSRSERVVEGLPVSADVSTPIADDDPLVQYLARECDIDELEAALLARRTLRRIARTGFTDVTPADVQAAIAWHRNSSHIPLSCHEAARLTAVLPPPTAR